MSSQLGPASTCTSSSGRGLFPSSLPFAFTLLINKLLVLEVKVACTCLCARVAVQQEQPGVLNAADGGQEQRVWRSKRSEDSEEGTGTGTGRSAPAVHRSRRGSNRPKRGRDGVKLRHWRSADAWLINSCPAARKAAAKT